MCQVTYYKSHKITPIDSLKLLPLLLVTLLHLVSESQCQLPRLNASRVAEINRIPWKPIKNPLNRVGYIHSSASELRSFTSSEVTNGNNNNHNNDGPNVGTAPAVVQHRPNGATVGLDIPDSNIRLLLDIDELAAKSSAESLKFKVHNAENQVINTGPPYSAPLSVEGNQNHFHHQPQHRPAPAPSPAQVNPSVPPYIVGSSIGPFPLPSPTPSSSNKKYQIGYVRAQDLQAALNTGVIPPGAKTYPVPPTANLPLPIPTQQPNHFNSPPLTVHSANGPASFQASGQYMVKYSQPLPGDGSFAPASGNLVDDRSIQAPPQPSLAPQTETPSNGGLSVAAASPSKTNTRPNSPSALAAPVKNARKKQQSQSQNQSQKQAKKSAGKRKQSGRARSSKLEQASTTTSTTTIESTTSTSTAAPVFFREETTEGSRSSLARLQQQKANQQQQQQQEKESDELNDDVQIQQQYQDADDFDDEIQAKLTDASKASSAPTSTSISPTSTSSTTTSTTTESNPSAALQEQQEDQLDSDEEQRQPARATGGKDAGKSERERLQAKGQQQSTQPQAQGKRKSPASEGRPVSERLRSVNSLRSSTSDSSSDEEESNANNNNDDDPDDMDDGFELLRTPTFMGSQDSSTASTCSPKSASLVSASAAESLTLKEFASKIGADAIFNKLPGVEEQLQSMADFANSGYTLFLPSNDAIERMPKSLFNKLKSNPEEIKKLLDNHVSDSKRDMNEMARNSAFMSPRAASAKIKIARGVDGAVLVNGQRVIRMNQKGPMGGSVHVIDGLLYPVADKNVMETLKSCNRFDGFVTLAEGTGLGDSLSSGKST